MTGFFAAGLGCRTVPAWSEEVATLPEGKLPRGKQVRSHARILALFAFCIYTPLLWSSSSYFCVSMHCHNCNQHGRRQRVNCLKSILRPTKSHVKPVKLSRLCSVPGWPVLILATAECASARDAAPAAMAPFPDSAVVTLPLPAKELLQLQESTAFRTLLAQACCPVTSW